MGNRLLLADDSITIQKVVAIIFANEEFELTVVDNGIAALEKAREVRPEVMLVDALMPGKSGYEVCAEVRRDPALASTPILLLIGAFEPFDEAKARECGADASITKPFESQQLIDRVKELLELGQSRAAAPAAAAAPAPAAAAVNAAAAEELWGDLSSFDTLAPAPPTPAAAAPSPAEVFFSPAPESEPAAPQPAPAAPKAAFAPVEPLVEASPEDDLWGAFDLEEIAEPAPVAAPQAAPVTQAAPVLQAAPTEDFLAEPQFETELFGFEDEEGIEDTGPALELDVVAGAELESPEELFSFAEEAEPAPAVAQPDPFNFQTEEPFSFEPEVTAPVDPFAAAAIAPLAAAAAAPATPAASEFVPSPAFEPAPAFAPEVAPAAPAAPAAAAQPAALSEADLVAALSKVSREVIERIVWEVVPDLAEVIIKEELRKLKAGMKR